MNKLTMETTELESSTDAKRIIGSIEGRDEGPCVILLAGIHGNEGAGVEAVEQVLKRLNSMERSFNGRLVAIRGNLQALDRDRRFIDEDMNRLWFSAIIDKIRAAPEHEIASSERVELKRLLPVIDEIREETDRPFIFVDVHTFSAEGALFTLPSHNPKIPELLSRIYAPMVLGIGDSLRGTSLKYFGNQGMLSFALEGGQHHNSTTEDNIIASIMLLLEALCCISEKSVHNMEEYRSYLKSYTQRLPVKTELVYQHIIEEGDRFEMQPGYKNFQPVKEGEWIATDQDGKILAQCDGYILMPLYQDQGDDGFFIIREITED